MIVLAGTVAILVTILRLAAKHATPLRAVLLRYALPGAAATLVLAPGLIRSIPVVGLAIACMPGVLAVCRARSYVLIRRPRALEATLLAGRLAAIIGANWGAHGLRIDYLERDAPSDVKAVLVELPRGVLPSKVMDKCRAAVAETLRGKWTVSSLGTLLTFRPAEEQHDPPAVKHLKAVLLDQKALGTGGSVEIIDYDESSGEIKEFIGRSSQALANVVASSGRQTQIDALLNTRVPVPNKGSWATRWDSAGVPTVHATVSAFCERILMPVKDDFVTSKAEAVERYAEARFEVGVHADGEICTRRPKKEPNGVNTGAPGMGKTTFQHVHTVEASRWGFIIIIVDGKTSSSYVGFRDWPGVQIVANDMYTIVRTIYYVAEILARRQDGGRTGDLPVGENIPVYFIVDEYADMVTRMQRDLWEPYRAGDNDLPKRCPAIEILERLPQMIREFKIHMDTGTQKPDSDRISPNIIFTSDKKSQWGQMTGAQSQAYWQEFHTGPSVPPIAGRGVIKTEVGDPRPVQGYYVPDPLTAETREELELLAALMPPVSLHRRIVFDIPDPTIATWDEIASAPWYFAEDRPDLDPLSPEYNPPLFLRYDTFGNLNAATLDTDTEQ